MYCEFFFGPFKDLNDVAGFCVEFKHILDKYDYDGWSVVHIGNELPKSLKDLTYIPRPT